jgi:hypothetical protein
MRRGYKTSREVGEAEERLEKEQEALSKRGGETGPEDQQTGRIEFKTWWTAQMMGRTPKIGRKG